MLHEDETVGKFLTALNTDSIKDIVYCKKIIYHSKCMKCVCGQPIKNCYLFRNKINGKQCVVGKNCLQHITAYLNW